MSQSTFSLAVQAVIEEHNAVTEALCRENFDLRKRNASLLAELARLGAPPSSATAPSLADDVAAFYEEIGDSEKAMNAGSLAEKYGEAIWEKLSKFDAQVAGRFRSKRAALLASAASDTDGARPGAEPVTASEGAVAAAAKAARETDEAAAEAARILLAEQVARDAMEAAERARAQQLAAEAAEKERAAHEAAEAARIALAAHEAKEAADRERARLEAEAAERARAQQLAAEAAEKERAAHEAAEAARIASAAREAKEAADRERARLEADTLSAEREKLRLAALAESERDRLAAAADLDRASAAAAAYEAARAADAVRAIETARAAASPALLSIAAHKSTLVSFYAVHRPENANPQKVEELWLIMGKSSQTHGGFIIWPKLAQKYGDAVVAAALVAAGLGVPAIDNDPTSDFSALRAAIAAGARSPPTSPRPSAATLPPASPRPLPPLADAVRDFYLRVGDAEKAKNAASLAEKYGEDIWSKMTKYDPAIVAGFAAARRG